MSDEENVATRRSRRSTAGNRMQAAFAEINIEDVANDMDEDRDFVDDKEQEDVFESDFESTDEEATQSELITGEKEVQDEEKRSRKQAKSKLEKITAVAEARFRATFNPDVTIEEKVDQKQKARRRVSIVNAETGDVIATDEPTTTAVMNERSLASSKPKIRQSRRKQTMQNTVETVKRLKSSEVKKAAAPKKAKVVKKHFTQGELLARALDTEEGNLVEHRDYLMLEEERRRRAKVVKTAAEGPLVRWVSRLEQVQVAVPNSDTTSAPPSAAQTVSYPTTSSYTGSNGALGTNTVLSQIRQPTPAIAPVAGSTEAALHQTTPVSSTPTQVMEPPQPVIKNETVAKNYVIHELGQFDGIRKPNWSESMKALFGDHVAWDEVRVYVGKGRPMSRPKHICPITGKQAMYFDPRTGVPYANVEAFKVLTGLLEHEYIWNAELGCYVGQEETRNDDVDMDQ
ncbi:hypothetical protein M378DRAFT_81541 [Amanita muscaria Koide BX008]|uniref:Vps72/YL1 C-terminal domain-containing protein n=1 Tax=Amanita muscaria (strain Koide BX008) TaxID=946122 RepID=A0A0C2SGG0_AMAMK|nr:hypothetical protein M378DRAFT_81541 [Amanita muscaria Koide BX008]